MKYGTYWILLDFEGTYQSLISCPEVVRIYRDQQHHTPG